MRTPSFSIILPIYNQADHIDVLVKRYTEGLKKLNETYELIFVVNGSTDDSYDRLQSIALDRQDIKIFNIKQGGWGKAVRCGILKSSGLYVCYTNSARTQIDDLITILTLAKLNSGSMIKATRIVRDNLIRRIGSVLYNFEMRLLFGVPIFDVNGTPKVIPKEHIKDMELLSEDDTIDAEIVMRCSRQNIPILEVPIKTTPRIGGSSTTNLRSAWNMYLGLLLLKMSTRAVETKETLWEAQSKALRKPLDLLSGGEALDHGLVAQSLEYTVDDNFVRIVEKLGVTLLITREYEHLTVALSIVKGEMKQTYVHLPHPSGLVVNREDNAVYIAATRNPNQIWTFKPIKRFLDRLDYKNGLSQNINPLMPTRTKFFSGAHYFHDLALIGSELFANSVGQNAIVKINLNSDNTDEPVWWPKSLESIGKRPDMQRNYLQLNSIAAGNSLETSFFSASSAHIRNTRPGDIEFPVDGSGVIFSGKTREVYGTGLTRPHSARLHNGSVWVDNSGYGEVGYIDHGKFLPVVKLPGWTRGLCFKEGIVFVGVSRVLPKFRVYAPGLEPAESNTCGVWAVDAVSGKIIGSIRWPFANQIFAIDYIDSSVSMGFTSEKFAFEDESIHDTFYGYTT